MALASFRYLAWSGSLLLAAEAAALLVLAAVEDDDPLVAARSPPASSFLVAGVSANAARGQPNAATRANSLQDSELRMFTLLIGQGREWPLGRKTTAGAGQGRRVVTGPLLFGVGRWAA